MDNYRLISNNKSLASDEIFEEDFKSWLSHDPTDYGFRYAEYMCS